MSLSHIKKKLGVRVHFTYAANNSNISIDFMVSHCPANLDYNQARTQEHVRGFKHPPPPFFSPVFFLACLSERSVMSVTRIPLPRVWKDDSTFFLF